MAYSIRAHFKNISTNAHTYLNAFSNSNPHTLFNSNPHPNRHINTHAAYLHTKSAMRYSKARTQNNKVAIAICSISFGLLLTSCLSEATTFDPPSQTLECGRGLAQSTGDKVVWDGMLSPDGSLILIRYIKFKTNRSVDGVFNAQSMREQASVNEYQMQTTWDKSNSLLIALDDRIERRDANGNRLGVLQKCEHCRGVSKSASGILAWLRANLDTHEMFIDFSDSDTGSPKSTWNLGYSLVGALSLAPDARHIAFASSAAFGRSIIFIGDTSSQTYYQLGLNDLPISWVSNNEVLMPDENDAKIWRVNVETKTQTLVGNLKFSDPSTRVAGASADENMKNILVLASQHIEGTHSLTRGQLFLVDAACLAKTLP